MIKTVFVIVYGINYPDKIIKVTSSIETARKFIETYNKDNITEFQEVYPGSNSYTNKFDHSEIFRVDEYSLDY